MKKTILTLLIFLTIQMSAQDGYNQTPAYYQEVAAKTVGLTATDVGQFAIEVTENLEYQYIYYKRQATPYKLSVTYQSENGEDELTLVFKVNKPSADKSIFAEKADILSIIGNQETLISIWQYYFLPTATKKQIRNNHKYRILRDEINFLNPNGSGVHFRLVEKSKFWIIENRGR